MIGRKNRIQHYETVRRRKDGALIEVSISISPVRDGARRIIGASKIVRDIGPARQVQAALRESEAPSGAIARIQTPSVISRSRNSFRRALSTAKPDSSSLKLSDRLARGL